MFIAWRDMRFARGRFALITAVVLLITLLIGLLAGLTGGLAQQNISAVQALGGERIVLAGTASGADGDAAEAEPASFSESRISADEVRTWEDARAVSGVRAVGITQFAAEHGETGSSVALLGGTADSPAGSGRAVLSSGAAEDLSASDGDTITVLGLDLRVTVMDEERWYAHTPAVYLTLEDWQEMQLRLGQPETAATALVIGSATAAEGGATAEDGIEDLERTTGTQAVTPLNALLAISSFRSEIGSLLMMAGMLFGISALVIGAFFTVWTMQRQADVAVLRALGAPASALLRDALGQSLVVLVAGVLTGIGITAALGTVISTAVPFVVTWYTTALPAALMVVLGAAGAAFALRQVTRVDPLTALGSAR
ncbi:ABC transporter permease [Brevibacterium salitolerans]|uniref:ABC transporter permease n=1 Tax=Brevibacterium salitolerans TaxID=1403566 RepID=A0ABN2WU46_9MICO